jgi:hypothetical protein
MRNRRRRGAADAGWPFWPRCSPSIRFAAANVAGEIRIVRAGPDGRPPVGRARQLRQLQAPVERPGGEQRPAPVRRAARFGLLRPAMPPRWTEPIRQPPSPASFASPGCGPAGSATHTHRSTRTTATPRSPARTPSAPQPQRSPQDSPATDNEQQPRQQPTAPARTGIGQQCHRRGTIMPSTETGISAAVHADSPCASVNVCMCRWETAAEIPARTITLAVVAHRIHRSPLDVPAPSD